MCPAPARPRPADPYPIPPLNDILDPKIAICQLLGPDLGGVWESTHKFSANSAFGIDHFCKKTFLLYKISRLKGQKNAQTDFTGPKIPPRDASST